MKDLGEAENILGMKINRDRITCRIWLSQENYVMKMLERCNMAEVKPITTLLAGHFRLFSNQCLNLEEDKDEMSRILYASAI